MSSTAVLLPASTDRVVAGPVLADLAALETVIGRLARVGRARFEGTGPSELLAIASRLGVVQRQVDALRLQVVARIDEEDATRATGSLSTASWLRSQGQRPGAANRDLELARTLSSHDHVAEALTDGAISSDHATVITKATDQLPDRQRAEGDARLVEAAGRMDPGELAKEAVRVLTRLHPDGDARLERAERLAKARREFSLVPTREGGVALVGALDAEGAAYLDAALSPLAAPRPATDSGPDLRSAARRRADALVELARRSLAAGEPPVTGGVRPTVVVTMTLAQLTEALAGTAELAGAAFTAPISAAAARRAACDAGLIPAVLGGESELLDLGRSVRTATPAQRRALALRDGGCAAPSCDRPPSWCQAHHIRPWSLGGVTDLDGLVLLCDPHHDLVHAGVLVVAAGEGGGRARIHAPPGGRPP